MALLLLLVGLAAWGFYQFWGIERGSEMVGVWKCTHDDRTRQRHPGCDFEWEFCRDGTFIDRIVVQQTGAVKAARDCYGWRTRDGKLEVTTPPSLVNLRARKAVEVYDIEFLSPDEAEVRLLQDGRVVGRFTIRRVARGQD